MKNTNFIQKRDILKENMHFAETVVRTTEKNIKSIVRSVVLN
ncbi:MAG: hypothetical protein ACFFHV_06060 [Promethearchaeota archaeon]